MAGFVLTQPDGQEVPVMLCLRCVKQVFSADSWAKLLGPETDTEFVGESSDACYDGEHVYTEVDLGGRLKPRKRSPILRFIIPVKDLLDSARSFCGFCRIVTGLDTEKRLATGRYERAQVDLQLFEPAWVNGGVLLWFLVQVTLTLDRAKEPTWENKTLLAMTPEKAGSPAGMQRVHAPATSTVSLPPPSRSKGPLAVFAHVKELKDWMKECEHHHAKCASSQQARLPTRVIDVLDFGATSHVKLREFAERPRGRYVALSYVWGSNHTMRLLQSTLGSFKNGISLVDGPQTLQDAVLVTRSLDIQYLWVDSLCILQDSDLDKDVQIPFMNEYYRDAAAVISASGAADVHAGFLSPQETASDVLARIRSQTVGYNPKYGSIPHRINFVYPDMRPVICIVDTKPRLYSYDHEPINKRGWTLQESALARRLLTFPSTGGLIMRCHEGSKLAGQVMSNPFHEDSGLAHPWDGALTSSEALFVAKLSERWASIVQDYSGRALSQPGDILVALGALAQDFHARHGAVLGSYVAGIWTNLLREGLLWHIAQLPHSGRESFIPPSRAVSQYHAPSWSWASCEQPVIHRIRKEPDLGGKRQERPDWYIEVLDCSVTPRSQRNPWGAVETAFLELKGSLVPIKRVPITGDPRPDGCEVEDVALAVGESSPFATINRVEIFAPDSIDALALIDATCYWLPIYNATRARHRGLIVRQVNEGHFRRLAFVEILLMVPSAVEQAAKRTIRLV